MGAVPKKKPSLTRANQRHSAWVAKMKKTEHTTTAVCDHCGETKLSHRVCKQCGFYNGKPILEPKTRVRRVEA